MEKTAMFAGGCFWCMIQPFESLEGINNIEVGYSGGFRENPTYEDVSKEDTGHYQVVKMNYDDELISYEKLLDVFFDSIDPTDEEGQFGDNGESFKSVIFYFDYEQDKIAREYIEYLEENNVFGYLISTKILPARKFYKAEESNQNFYKKNPILYEEYIRFSGRYEYLKRSFAMRNLTKLQYEVTQNKYREKAFNNEYYDNFQDGIYVDIIDNTPLFSSKEKLKGNYGWPTFYKPIDDKLIKFIRDDAIVNKIEIRTQKSDIHLGYVLNDTLEDLRNNILSINSSSIRFIPSDKVDL